VTGPGTHDAELPLLAEGEHFPGTALQPAGCEACGQAHLVPERLLGAPCLACGQGPMTPQPARVRTAPPELVGTSELSDQELVNKLTAYAGKVRFRCKGLAPAEVARRATKVWWPMWLVDARFEGRWQGQVGFDYEVQSSRGVFRGEQLTTEEVMETRIRWEDRLGTAARAYDNAAGRALDDHDALARRLGGVQISRSRAYDPATVADAAIRLPDQDTEEAWPDAEGVLVSMLADECRTAVDAAHVQGVTVDGTWHDKNWTWLLLPMIVSHYKDDKGRRHLLWVNGQTGHASGRRMASVKKGMLWAGIVLTVSLVIGLAGVVLGLVGLAILPLLILAIPAICLAFLIAPFALWPAIAPWWWNRKQRD